VRLRRSWNEIVEQLGAEPAAAAGPQAAPTFDATLRSPPTPWFVRALIGAGAWIAALFVLGAIAVAMHGEEGLLPLGALALGAGIVMLRLATGEFVRQLGLSTSLAGQGALAVGLADALGTSAFLAASLVAEAILVAVVAYPVHRFFSAVLAVLAGIALVAQLGLPAPLDLSALALAAGAAVMWLHQPRRLRRAGLDPWAPVAHALVLSLLALLLAGLADGGAVLRSLLDKPAGLGRLASAGLGLGVVMLALAISAEAGVPRPTPLRAAALAGLALLGFVTPRVPGVAAAAGVLLLGLHRRNSLLLGVAIVFLIAFLGLLYYDLETTLLAKALHLMTAGAVLVAAAWLLHRQEAR
jgi:hypothetical protein